MFDSGLYDKPTRYDVQYKSQFKVKLGAFRDSKNFIRLNEVIDFNNRIKIYNKPDRHTFVESY